MSKPEYQDIINEYKESVRILKQEVAELQDAGKSKDSANKRTLQKLEHVTRDLEEANKKIKQLEENHDKENKKSLG
jgi:NADH:ubiquinone oxidoreductase subunit D|tara:strand:+ start:67 stop:294 length:228 start_codon:yes stop_codon:yes gene_type:complete